MSLYNWVLIPSSSDTVTVESVWKERAMKMGFADHRVTLPPAKDIPRERGLLVGTLLKVSDQLMWVHAQNRHHVSTRISDSMYTCCISHKVQSIIEILQRQRAKSIPGKILPLCLRLRMQVSLYVIIKRLWKVSKGHKSSPLSLQTLRFWFKASRTCSGFSLSEGEQLKTGSVWRQTIKGIAFWGRNVFI